MILTDLLVRHIDELITCNPSFGDPLGRITDGAVAFADGRVVYVGSSDAAPPAARTIEGRGCVGLPGLVDCHTHALYAGSRADELRRRLAGASYSEILEAGGGILSTMRAVRAAPDERLAELLHARLQGMLQMGVTTVEVKTGYALDPENERRCLKILREGDWPVRVIPTFLGAHALPPEYRQDRGGYLRLLLDRMIPEAVGLAEAVDVYCDRGAFTVDEARQILEAGLSRGLVARIHAEQVVYTGAAAMAAGLGAASADHLERIDEAGIAAMAARGCVGVMLPGAMLYLRDSPPPARRMIEAGMKLAVSTDLNPGSSPVRDLWACATLACLSMGLTVEEAILGITRHAGLALGRPELGWLGPGSAADLALMRPPPGEPASGAALVQYLGGHRAAAVVRAGRLVEGAPGGYGLADRVRTTDPDT